MQRVPDGYFLSTVAPAAGQNSDIGVFKENEDGIGVSHGVQALPVDSGMLGLEAEVTS